MQLVYDKGKPFSLLFVLILAGKSGKNSVHESVVQAAGFSICDFQSLVQ